MNHFVLDCSVTMRWCFADDKSAYAQFILHQLTTCEAHVPSLWSLEVANVLLVAERRDQLTPADSTRFVALLGSLPIRLEPDSFSRSLGDILPIARAQHLSSYDAAYLELAMRLGYPIATLDERIKRAAKPVGVALMDFPKKLKE